MFWKHFEDISTKLVVHVDSVEFRNLKLMAVETLAYFALLFMFTLYAYNLQSKDSYYVRQEQLDYWRACDSDGNCDIREVTDMDSMWRYMRNVMVPRAFTEYAVDPPEIADIMTSFAGNSFTLLHSSIYWGTDE